VTTRAYNISHADELVTCKDYAEHCLAMANNTLDNTFIKGEAVGDKKLE